MTRRPPTEPSVKGEIAALARAGKLRVQSLEEASALTKRIIEEAIRWAEQYERKLEGRPHISDERKCFGRAAFSEAARLRNFLLKYHVAVGEPLAPPKYPLSRRHIAKVLRHAAMLAERLEQISRACNEPIPGIQGRPPDGWLLGFIWGMAAGWRELTTAKVTPRGYFSRFLQPAFEIAVRLSTEREIAAKAAQLAEKEPEPPALIAREKSRITGDLSRLKIQLSLSADTVPEWETLIKTAMARFEMKRDPWLRPGDDLTRFPLSKTLPRQ